MFGSIEIEELPKSNPLNVDGKPPNGLPLKQPLRLAVREAPNHTSNDNEARYERQAPLFAVYE